MEKLKLIKPNIDYLDQIQHYKEQFKQTNEVMAGSSFLDTTDSIGDWIKNVNHFFIKETVPEGFAYGGTWLVIREADDCIVGMTNLRAELINDYLKEFGGHIGYSVIPAERRKGYGTEILRLTVEKAKEFGLTEVLVTCNNDNFASRKVIENNHGKLESNVKEDEKVQKRRYWIDV